MIRKVKMLNKEYLERKLAKLEKEKERLEKEAAFLKKHTSSLNLKEIIRPVAIISYIILLLIYFTVGNKVYLHASYWLIGLMVIVKLIPSFYMSVEGLFIYRLVRKYHPKDLPTIRRIYERLATMPFTKTYLEEEGYFAVFIDEEELDYCDKQGLSIISGIYRMITGVNQYIKEFAIVAGTSQGKKALTVFIKPITNRKDYKDYFPEEALGKIETFVHELNEMADNFFIKEALPSTITLSRGKVKIDLREVGDELVISTISEDGSLVPLVTNNDRADYQVQTIHILKAFVTLRHFGYKL